MKKACMEDGKLYALKINGRNIPVDKMNHELENMIDRFSLKIGKLVGDVDISEIKEIIREVVGESVGLTIDYSQDFCSNMENEYKNLFTHINVGMGFSDRKSKKIVSVNEYFCKMLEIEAKDVVGMEIKSFQEEYMVDSNQIQTGKDKLMEKGTLDSFEILMRTKSGKEKWFLVSSKFIPNLNQESFTIMDIGALKELDMMRDMHMRTIAHDIRNPLAGAVGFLDLAQRASIGENEKQKKYLDRLGASLTRIDNFTKTYLDILKMEMGIDVLKRSKIDIVCLMKDVIDKFNELNESKGLYVDFIHIEGEEAIIEGDWLKLEFCFENVIKNAIEETDKNKGNIVKVRLIKTEEEVIFICNNIGVMSEDSKDKLFKKKYVKSDKTSGSGFGSYSASLIARAHKGKIEVISSNEESGTTIGMTFPRVQKIESGT